MRGTKSYSAIHPIYHVSRHKIEQRMYYIRENGHVINIQRFHAC